MQYIVFWSLTKQVSNLGAFRRRLGDPAGRLFTSREIRRIAWIFEKSKFSSSDSLQPKIYLRIALTKTRDSVCFRPIFADFDLRPLFSIIVKLDWVKITPGIYSRLRWWRVRWGKRAATGRRLSLSGSKMAAQKLHSSSWCRYERKGLARFIYSFSSKNFYWLVKCKKIIF